MHDGKYATIEGAVKHYQNGGEHHPNQDSIVSTYNFSDDDKYALIAFLKTLTDTNLQQ